MSRVHAFGDDALADLDAVGLAARIAAGEASAAEVVEAAIARAEAVDAQLNGLAHRTFERARAEARRPGPGFLAGVPSLLKDNVAVAGVPSQQGCDAFVAAPARADGDFARLYRGTGLLPLGTSQLSEYGFSASAEHPRLGAVRNPWSTEHTAGASSAGSAALVAAGVVPIAHANDGGGSIRIPAAVCGLVGLKPTRGRLAQDRTFRAMPVRIVSDGVLTRSVRDTAAFLREAERAHRNLRLPPVGDLTRPGTARLRVALVTDSVGRSADPEAAEAARDAARLLESLGHRVTELPRAPVPEYFADDFLLYWSFLATVLLRTGARAHRGTWVRERHDELTLGLDRHARRRLHRLPLAIARLRASRHVSARHYRRYDVTLTPTLAHATPRIGHLDPTQPFETVMERLLDWVAFTPLQNATGEPAISLPLATDAQGLPLGVMLGAAQGREATLLGLAYELEEARPWRRIDAG